MSDIVFRLQRVEGHGPPALGEFAKGSVKRCDSMGSLNSGLPCHYTATTRQILTKAKA